MPFFCQVNFYNLKVWKQQKYCHLAEKVMQKNLNDPKAMLQRLTQDA